MTNIQFKRGGPEAAPPPLKPGEPALLGSHLYVGDLEGNAVKLSNSGEVDEKVGALEARLSAADLWETYVQGKTYYPRNKVVFNGTLYVCVAEVTGRSPLYAEYWSQIVKNFSAQVTQTTTDLYAADWLGSAAPYTQNAFISDFEGTEIGEVGLAQEATAAQRAAARAALLSVTGQEFYMLTITADGEKPKVDLPITITILKREE